MVGAESAHLSVQAALVDPLLLPGHTFWETALAFAPISALLLGGKLATFASYSYVSMSLAQTAKALEPVFNVILAWSLYGERRPLVVQMSLVPIVCGVALASISEPSFQIIGFAAAMGSGMLKVLQNIYTKRVMDKRTMGFFQIHLWCALVSLAVLAPVMAAEAAAKHGSNWLDPGRLVDDLSRNVAATLAGSSVAGSGLPGSAGARPFPWVRLVLCAACQYMSSVASYGVLSRIHHLTFTIANTMKRLIIIGGGVLWFANAVTPLNVLGMGLAIAGVAGYNTARRWAEPAAAATSPAAAGGTRGAAAELRSPGAALWGPAAEHLKTDGDDSGRAPADEETGWQKWAERGGGPVVSHRAAAATCSRVAGAAAEPSRGSGSRTAARPGATGAGWSLLTGAAPQLAPPAVNGGTGGSPGVKGAATALRPRDAPLETGAQNGAVSEFGERVHGRGEQRGVEVPWGGAWQPGRSSRLRVGTPAEHLPQRAAQEVTPLPDGEIVRVSSFT